MKFIKMTMIDVYSCIKSFQLPCAAPKRFLRVGPFKETLESLTDESYTHASIIL